MMMCGATGTPCCPGGTCMPPAVCSGVACVMPSPDAGSDAAVGPCGFPPGARCCPGMLCFPPLRCAAGLCTF
jgi:hypothetical protein